MRIQSNQTVDMSLIETQARRARAKYIAGFFQRRAR
jgi:hypothetical protein